MTTGLIRTVGLVLLLVVTANPVAAQAVSLRGAAELSIGWAGFADEALIDHAVFGGSARLPLTPRVSVGPELVYMRGPGTDRDLFVTGNLTFDMIPRGSARRAVSPFFVIGAGLMRHQTRFGPTGFSHTGGAVTGGGGARFRLSDQVYALGEIRGGWEPHLRLTGGIGVRWP